MIGPGDDAEDAFPRVDFEDALDALSCSSSVNVHSIAAQHCCRLLQIISWTNGVWIIFRVVGQPPHTKRQLWIQEIFQNESLTSEERKQALNALGSAISTPEIKGV